MALGIPGQSHTEAHINKSLGRNLVEWKTRAITKPTDTNHFLCRHPLLLQGLLLVLILGALAGTDLCVEGNVGDLCEGLLGFLRDEWWLVDHVVTLGTETTLLCLKLRLFLQLVTGRLVSATYNP